MSSDGEPNKPDIAASQEKLVIDDGTEYKQKLLEGRYESVKEIITDRDTRNTSGRLPRIADRMISPSQRTLQHGM
jgi:hypothetical protein